MLFRIHKKKYATIVYSTNYHACKLCITFDSVQVYPTLLSGIRFDVVLQLEYTLFVYTLI